MMTLFNLNGFYNWDVVAAAFIANVSLFTDSLNEFRPDEQKLQMGLLTNKPIDGTLSILNLPVIKDLKAFTDDVYNSWLGLNLF